MIREDEKKFWSKGLCVSTASICVASEHIDAPIFEELPMALECKLISYDEETCRLIGEIVNVSADESVLGEKVGNAFQDGLKLK